MSNDKEQRSWVIEVENLKSTADDLATNILEKKRLSSRALNTADIERHISNAFSIIKEGIAGLESQLSTAESKGIIPKSQLRDWEQSILALSKQYDHLEALAKSDDRINPRAQLLSARELQSPATLSSNGHQQNHFELVQDLKASEVLQLNERIMQEHDNHLDELAETIGRQRQIGLMISNELDLHADLMEEVDEAVDRTQNRLRMAGKRLSDVTKDTKICGIATICVLFFILVLVIIFARHR